jgi:signal peptidase I
MLQFLKVTGRSLEPSYHEGDFVLAVKIPFSAVFYRPGDVVVFRHKVYGTLIKRIDHLVDGGRRLYVLGTASSSVDSDDFGPISTSAVIGKVVGHWKKK